MNRTIVRAISILDLIAKNKNGTPLMEIANTLEMPKSTTYEIVQTLLNLRLLETNIYNPKLYVLGSKTFVLGSNYVSTNDIIHFGSYHLREIADKYDKTGFIGFLDEDKVIYVYKWQSPKAKLAASDLGTRNPLYCTSLGKAILAYLPNNKRKEIIENTVFEKKTENTILSKEELLEDLELVRKRGYSIDNREIEAHMACLGAPIFDYTGNVVAAISVSDLYNSNESVMETIGNELKEIAEKISSKLGYIPRS
jgi:DNA-binding IclR family transcriptional regulator